MSEPFPELKADPWDIYSRAHREHKPQRVFALFSGGNDSVRAAIKDALAADREENTDA